MSPLSTVALYGLTVAVVSVAAVSARFWALSTEPAGAAVVAPPVAPTVVDPKPTPLPAVPAANPPVVKSVPDPTAAMRRWWDRWWDRWWAVRVEESPQHRTRRHHDDDNDRPPPIHPRTQNCPPSVCLPGSKWK